MRVAIYARVSSESQEARGTIGSQLEVLRARIRAEGHELVAEFCDDGYSGARLDRPVLDELAQFGVRVIFADAPPLDDDPQARLLTQVQGVIAEYERAKITERNRRGKLFRSRAGEVIAW